jgi:hypothetical protein
MRSTPPKPPRKARLHPIPHQLSPVELN